MSNSDVAACAAARREREQRRRFLLDEARRKARSEEDAVAEGVAETVGLEEARGAMFIHPDRTASEGRKPLVRLDGLAWLAAKERLTTRQVQAGARYGRLVQIIEGGDVSSCMALLEIRGTGRRGSPTDGKVWARAQLAEAREAVGEHPGLIFALDQICGRGPRPREVTTDQRASERLEDRLGVGLDLLVRAWGM